MFKLKKYRLLSIILFGICLIFVQFMLYSQDSIEFEQADLNQPESIVSSDDSDLAQVVVSPTFTSEEYVKKCWSLQGANRSYDALNTAQEGIAHYQSKADAQAAQLTSLPTKEEISLYKEMNDVATCYFISGEILRSKAELAFDKDEAKELTDKAIATLNIIIEKYPYAQQFDPRGWYWSLSEKAKTIIEK